MGRKQGPRKGSMQVWPRKRAEKFLPRVNWSPLNSRLNNPHTYQILHTNSVQRTNILGFIGYKAGMASAYVKDNTPDSMTKNKKIIVPVTILECPPMKILSIRFHKNNQVAKEIINEVLDKDLKRIIRMPKKKINAKELLDKIEIEDFEDLTVIVYSEAKKTEIKKTPDISEVALSGNFKEKLEFVKSNLSKEINVSDVFANGIVDVRGITKGKGFQGAIKRFGARLRFHKSEKGVRRIGSIGAWHPTGVRFRVPMAGQMGLFTRITMNNSIIASKKFDEKDIVTKKIFANYGRLKTDYLVLMGSVQGPQKRQLLITASLRPSKKQAKKNYELLEIR